eukprot:403342567
MESNNIYYICIGRVKDSQVLFSYLSNKSYQDKQSEFSNYAQMLLTKQSTSLNMDQRQKTEYLGFSWHSLQDQNSIVYLAVTRKDYPDDVCTKFLRQISTQIYSQEPDFKRDPQNVISLSSNARNWIMDSQMKFQDHKNLDKTVVAQGILEKATNAMKQNIGRIMDNRGQFEDLEKGSDQLKDTASRFRMNSARLEKQARWRNLKIKIILAVAVVLFSILIFYFVL